ncbi:hypothetical protein C8R46DRAFT_1186854 [Mycena filopes]|nr:hypothetical protein C8R46DRAFT_1186854 [Mycena filopes]
MTDTQMLESEEPASLTPAQKRKITIARAAEKTRQDLKAFEAETKAAGGGRQAKRDAKANAVWKVDGPATRKRASSLEPEVPDKSKKPRKSAPTDTAQETLESTTKAKVSSSSKRSFAAPVIHDSDSEPEPAPVLPKSKSKAAGKAKQTGAAAKVAAAGKTISLPATKPKAAAAKPKPPPAKIIADSESEEAASSDEDKGSNSEMVDFEDANEEEFLVEVPRIVAKKAAAALDGDSGSEDDAKMSDAKSADQLFDSDQESIEIDKPRRRRSVVEPDSDDDDDLIGAPPRLPIGDDDRMLHEAIADALVEIPQGHHRRRSSGSSWSSGNDLRVPDSEAEDDDEVPVKKPRKISAARQKQANLEKPEIREAPPPVKREEREDAVDQGPVRSEASYHASTRIAYPPHGKKDILLNSQSEELQGVIRTTITNVKRAVVFESAYPPIIARAGFARKYLIVAAEQEPEARHILARLRSDLNFAVVLADIILDRINILRGDFKRAAVSPGLFKFAGLSEEKTKELVEKLLKDHRYIFPVDPKTVQVFTFVIRFLTSRQGRLMHAKPFLNPVFSAVMKQAVFNRTFKANNMHLFASTSKRHPKDLELPDAMVALPGTAVYASLLEYRATGARQTIAFTEGAYEDTYQNHMKTLADTRDYAPVALHKVLHELFSQVTDGKTTQPDAGSSSTLINLIEVDESD